MVDNWNRIYDIENAQAAPGTVTIIKYENLIENGREEFEAFFKFIRMETNALSLRMPVYHDTIDTIIFRNVFNAYNLVQTKCDKFLLTYHYNPMSLEEYIIQ